MLPAYNTNGLAHHDLLDAIALLDEIGCRGVAITLDHGWRNSLDTRFETQFEQAAGEQLRGTFGRATEIP